jgi:hypothetical protein
MQQLGHTYSLVGLVSADEWGQLERDVVVQLRRSAGSAGLAVVGHDLGRDLGHDLGLGGFDGERDADSSTGDGTIVAQSQSMGSRSSDRATVLMHEKLLWKDVHDHLSKDELISLLLRRDETIRIFREEVSHLKKQRRASEALVPHVGDDDDPDSEFAIVHASGQWFNTTSSYAMVT